MVADDAGFAGSGDTDAGALQATAAHFKHSADVYRHVSITGLADGRAGSMAGTYGSALGHEAGNRAMTQNGLASITPAQGRRVSYMGQPDATLSHAKTGHRHSITSAANTVQSAARREQEAARFKALQRMPYPMVISRMKLLLERLRTMQQALQAASTWEEGASRGRSSGGGHVTAELLPPGSRFPQRPTTGGGYGRPGTSGGGALHSSGSHSPHSQDGRRRSAIGRPGSPSAGGASAAHGLGHAAHSGGHGGHSGGGHGHGGDTKRSDTDGVDSVAMNKIIEELQVTFSFVSDFVRRLPASARLGMANVVRVESYKKDQIIFDTGDVATQFYIILTGSVQVFGHPPGNHKSRTVFTTLTRGDMLGELALLNNTKRGAAIAPLTSCTMLVVDKEDFLEVLGPHFRAQQDTMQTFMRKEVPAIASASASEVEHLCRNLMRSRYKQGKEFEVASEAQVYFLAEGSAHLELVGKPRPAGANSAHTHEGSSSGSSMRGLQRSSSAGGGSSNGRASEVADGAAAGGAAGAAPQRQGSVSHPWGTDDDDSFLLSETGVLSEVRMQHGVALGTLGMEGHKEAVRRRNISRCVVAKLDPGACFGGGSTLLGVGEMQGHLRVVLTSPLAEVYRIDVDAFVKHTTPALLKAVRDDTAFRLTYWLGRKATISAGSVVGHHDASIMARPPVAADDEDMASTLGRSSGGCGVASSLEACLKGALAAGGGVAGAKAGEASGAGGGAVTMKAGMAVKRAARPKADHVAGSGKYGPGTMSAIKHVQQLQTQLGLQGSTKADSHAVHNNSGDGDGGGSSTSATAAAGTSGATAAQRYWSNADNSASGTPLTPLLKSLYAEGLAPLAEKLDELAVRAERRGQDGLAALVAAAGKSRPVSAAVGRPSQAHSAFTALTPRTAIDTVNEEEEDTVNEDEEAASCGPSSSNAGADSGIGLEAAAGAGVPMVTWQRPSTAGALGVLQGYSGLDPSTVYGRASIRPCSAMPSSGGGKGSEWHTSGADSSPGRSRRPSTAGPASGLLATRHERPGSLIAAGIIWSRTSDAAFRPPLRQCLTFEEIRSSRAQERAMSAGHAPQPQQQQQGRRSSAAAARA